MPEQSSFDYAVLRVVPRVERGEFINAGVIVFCLQQRFLGARVLVDEPRLRALWPELDSPLDPALDIDLIRQHVEAVPRICAGDPTAGPIARLGQRERFHWLVSPRSTIIQVSPVHCGLSEDPQRSLDQLARQFLLGWEAGPKE